MRNPRTVFSLLLAVTLLPAFLSGQARPKVTLNPTLSPPKSPVLASGKNFLPGAHIIASLDTQQIGEALADASGAFKNARINIPSGIPEGRHTMAFIDVSNPQGYTVTLPFTIQTNWPQRRSDPQNTANNPFEWKLDTTTVKSLAPVWNTVGKTGACVSSVEYGDRLEPPAVIMGGVVYFNNDAAGLQALDSASGNLLWQFDTTGGAGKGNCGALVVGDNRHLVMIADTGGTVWAINTLTHAKAWSHSGFLTNGNTPLFLLSGGTSLFVSTTDYNKNQFSITSLDEIHGGNFNWARYDAGGHMAWNKGRIFSSSSLFGYPPAAFDSKFGSPIWQGQGFFLSDYDPVAADKAVYNTGTDGNPFGVNILASSALNGSTFWGSTAVEGSPALANGLLYASSSGFITAIDTTSGSGIWGSVLGYDTSFPIVANGIVYVGGVEDQTIKGYSNFVMALNGSDGTLLWRYDFPGPTKYANVPPQPIAVVDGTLYVEDLSSFPTSDIWAFR